MTLPTTLVRCNLFDQIGEPAIHAQVHVRLTVTEVDPDHGIVVPETITAQADESGYFELALWPNARGERESQYHVWVFPAQKCRDPIWDVLATVPADGPVDLRNLIDTPPQSSDRYVKGIETDDSLEGESTKGSPLSVTYAVRLIAGEDLGGHRVVLAENGQAFLADRSDPRPGQVLGITRHAAVQGQDVLVQAAGEMVEQSWNWSPGPIWLWSMGHMTQSRPASGSEIRVATALNENRIVVERGPTTEVVI